MERQAIKPAQKFVTILRPLAPLEQSSAQSTDWVPCRNSGKAAPFRKAPSSVGPRGSAVPGNHPLAAHEAKEDLDACGSVTSLGCSLPSVAILSPGVTLANYECSDKTLGPLRGNAMEIAGSKDEGPPQQDRLPSQQVVPSRALASSNRFGVERQLTLPATQPSAFSFGVGGAFFASSKASVAHHAPTTAAASPRRFEEAYFHPSLSDYTPDADAQPHASTVADTGEQPSLALSEMGPVADNATPPGENSTVAISVNAEGAAIAAPSDYAAAAPPLYFSYSAHDPPSPSNANSPAMVANSREEAEVRLSRRAVMEETAAWQHRNRQRNKFTVKYPPKDPTRRDCRPKSAGAHTRSSSAAATPNATTVAKEAPNRRNRGIPNQAALLEAHAQWVARSAKVPLEVASSLSSAAQDAQSPLSSPADLPNSATPANAISARTSRENTARLVEQRRVEALTRAAEGAALHEDFMGHQACMARTSGASVAWEQRCRESNQIHKDSKATARAATRVGGASTSGTRMQHHTAAAMSKECLGVLGTKGKSGRWSNSAVLHQLQTQLSLGGTAAGAQYSPHTQRAASKAKVRTTGQLTAAATSGELCGAFRESWDDRRDRHRTRNGQPLQLAPGSAVALPQAAPGPAPASSPVHALGRQEPSMRYTQSAPMYVPRPHEDLNLAAGHPNVSADCAPE